MLAALAGLASVAGAAGEGASADPALVTFGPLARINEGDHDFRQLIRISLPASAGTVKIRVFDPDAGGEFDEANGGFDTTTKFSLYGAGASPKLWRDAAGVVQESVEGTALDTASFATDAKTDGQWVTLFSTDAGKGAEAADGKRSFVLLVEGVSGNDGNVFDVAVSQSDDANKAPAGTKLYSYMPTFQVPRGNKLAELGLDVPAGAKELTVENFDAAGGAITFAGRFRSTSLSASGKSEWRRDDVALAGDEPGQIASVTAADGGETPNDMTVFVGEKAAGSDPADKPVAIDLPVHAFAPNKRPQVALKVTPQACGMMSFDASGSRDPEGGALSYRWTLGTGTDTAEGATVEKKFADPGIYQGRLEAFDASGLIGNGSAHDFSFFVKPPPVASFEAPALVAEGAIVHARRHGLDQPGAAGRRQQDRPLPMVDGRRHGDRAEGRRCRLRQARLPLCQPRRLCRDAHRHRQRRQSVQHRHRHTQHHRQRPARRQCRRRSDIDRRRGQQLRCRAFP